MANIDNNPVISTTESVTVTDSVAPLSLESNLVTSTIPLASTVNVSSVNNISDVRSTPSQLSLPVRGESRTLPIRQSVVQAQQIFDSKDNSDSDTPNVSSNDFYLFASTQAKRTLNDFIKIRLPHRGVNAASTLPDPSQDAEFYFVVNPNNFSVTRQTVDTQALTRGGWQFGIWGEDVFVVQVSGSSAGSMFTDGLTDEFSYFSKSYRNIMQLKNLIENNGYWFEGEEYDESASASDYLRRRIKMHQSIDLWIGNFIWSGMFDSFSLSQEADDPYLLKFNFSFLVWKERYRATSPYWGSIANTKERGHTYSTMVGSSGQPDVSTSLSQFSPAGINEQVSQITSMTSSNPYYAFPAIQSSASYDVSSSPSDAYSTMGALPSSYLVNPDSNSSFWEEI